MSTTAPRPRSCPAGRYRSSRPQERTPAAACAARAAADRRAPAKTSRDARGPRRNARTCGHAAPEAHGAAGRRRAWSARRCPGAGCVGAARDDRQVPAASLKMRDLVEHPVHRPVNEPDKRRVSGDADSGRTTDSQSRSASCGHGGRVRSTAPSDAGGVAVPDPCERVPRHSADHDGCADQLAVCADSSDVPHLRRA